MTYVGIYSSGKGIGAITDSQGSILKDKNPEKYDFCQKLFLIGGNLIAGTGISTVLHKTAVGLKSFAEDERVGAEELAAAALKMGAGIPERVIDETHIYIAGQDSSGFGIYCVVLAGRCGAFRAEKMVADGSGAPFAIEALQRDLNKGIVHSIYTEIGEIVSFLYDTAKEAADSHGVNRTFQIGFTNGSRTSVFYDPSVDIIVPDENNSHNKTDFEKLIPLLERKYGLRKEYNYANTLLLYNKKLKGEARRPEEILSEYEHARKEANDFFRAALSDGSHAMPAPPKRQRPSREAQPHIDLQARLALVNSIVRRNNGREGR